MNAPQCPVCGNTAARQNTRYGIRHSCCGLVSWGNHPLVDAETRAARQAAHAAFDPIWREGSLSRSEAYKRLAAKLGIPVDACHMKLMSKEIAALVPAAAQEIRVGV